MNAPDHAPGSENTLRQRGHPHMDADQPRNRVLIARLSTAWLNRSRRLSRDLENLTRNALAFVRLASIRLMLRKLCQI